MKKNTIILFLVALIIFSVSCNAEYVEESVETTGVTTQTSVETTAIETSIPTTVETELSAEETSQNSKTDFILVGAKDVHFWGEDRGINITSGWCVYSPLMKDTPEELFCAFVLDSTAGKSGVLELITVSSDLIRVSYTSLELTESATEELKSSILEISGTEYASDNYDIVDELGIVTHDESSIEYAYHYDYGDTGGNCWGNDVYGVWSEEEFSRVEQILQPYIDKARSEY